MGYPAGHILPESSVRANSTSDPLLSLVCQHPGMSIMDCDHSGFFGGSSLCTAPENRYYVTCSFGKGYILCNNVVCWFIGSRNSRDYLVTLFSDLCEIINNQVEVTRTNNGFAFTHLWELSTFCSKLCTVNYLRICLNVLEYVPVCKFCICIYFSTFFVNHPSTLINSPKCVACWSCEFNKILRMNFLVASALANFFEFVYCQQTNVKVIIKNFVGISGYHLIGSTSSNDGQVYVSFNPPTRSSCATHQLPVCYQLGAELLHTVTDVCVSLGFAVSLFTNYTYMYLWRHKIISYWHPFKASHRGILSQCMREYI